MKNVAVQNRKRRHKRIRARVLGTPARPRLSVFKSNKALYAQLIDDDAGGTLAEATTRNMKEKTMRERSTALGKSVAKKAQAKKVTKVVFDRGGFLYAGNIKALADGAREGGLIF